jgi:hypothetical protein
MWFGNVVEEYTGSIEAIYDKQVSQTREAVRFLRVGVITETCKKIRELPCRNDLLKSSKVTGCSGRDYSQGEQVEFNRVITLLNATVAGGLLDQL